MTLVTGASGFIGGHVARALATRGDPLRVLVRPTSDLRGLQGLEAEVFTGDLRQPETLVEAVRGCRIVYHVAADYRFWARRPREIFESNVDGARNVFEACQTASVEKVVYTSTVGTVGFSTSGEPTDESRESSSADLAGPYKRSKLQAEQVALKFAAKGLPLVVVNPTAPVGEADLKPTPTGQIVVDFLRGAMPAYLDTGLNVVDVRDVARGHLLAAERGKPGERYLLGAHNMSLAEILGTLARLTDRQAPRRQVPYAAAWTFAVCGEGLAAVTGRPPRAPLEAVRMARKKMFVRCDKARRELGYEPGPVEPALERAIAWFRENRYC